jgi:hypothetical protein
MFLSEYEHEDQGRGARGGGRRLLGRGAPIPGCATQGETMDELMRNLHEAIEGMAAYSDAPARPPTERTCRDP